LKFTLEKSLLSLGFARENIKLASSSNTSKNYEIKLTRLYFYENHQRNELRVSRFQEWNDDFDGSNEDDACDNNYARGNAAYIGSPACSAPRIR
jgi:hypothetical protein